MYPRIDILTQFGTRFLQLHPWLYNNEIKITEELKSLPSGSLVEICHKGRPLGIGYYNRHSLIAVRRLTELRQAIDESFFIHRLERALQLRAKFYNKPYYRLIFAEADGLPGLIIDRFNDVLSLQINTQGMELLYPLVQAALIKVLHPKTIFIQRDSPIRKSEGMDLLPAEVWGSACDTLEIDENGAIFQIDTRDIQKTGWFYDHRENRKLLSHLSQGLRVIDYFCYSGGFSIQAALGGALQVIGVDRSKQALENARLASRLNGVAEVCDFVEGEAFADITQRCERGELYDLVILDPPAFVKQKKDLAAGLRGYEKLIKQALNLVAPQGLLFIASCSYHVSSMELKNCISLASAKASRPTQILSHTKAGFDHPLLPQLAETDYLKGFLVHCGVLGA